MTQKENKKCKHHDKVSECADCGKKFHLIPMENKCKCSKNWKDSNGECFNHSEIWTKEETTIKPTLQPAQIYFHYHNGEEPVLVISKEGFFWKGEKVEDKYNIYERFNDWLKGARNE